MNGFFNHKETQSVSRPDGKTYSCASCGLYQYCNSPRMKPYGNFQRRIMNIGECPGGTEDERGLPWQGKTGNLLKKTYRRLGIDLFEDCVNLNTVSCRPMDGRNYNRTPNAFEMDCCRSVMVYPAIKKYKPQKHGENRDKFEKMRLCTIPEIPCIGDLE